MDTALCRKLILRNTVLLPVGADIFREYIAQIWFCHARLLRDMTTLVRQTPSSAAEPGFAAGG